MATAKFYLKDPKSNKPSLIYLYYSFNGIRLKYSTGESILPSKWNHNRQRARSLSIKPATSLPTDNDITLNDYLDKLEAIVNSVKYDQKVKGNNLTTELFREELNRLLQKDGSKPAKRYFNNCIEEYISAKKHFVSESTIKKFHTIKADIQEYKPELQISEVNESFLLELITKHYLEKKNHLNPTIEKNINAIKSLLIWCNERGYNPNAEGIKFSLKKHKISYSPSPIPLTIHELEKLEKYDLSDKPDLDIIRDIYCFGCYTGLRISDIKKLKKANFIGNVIKTETIKTKTPLSIPILPETRNILEKYNYLLPLVVEQVFNRKIKQICEMAGINVDFLVVKYQGNKRIELDKPKFNFITAHTCRDTFITYLLAENVPPHIVISYTGHTDIEMLKPYYLFVESDKAKYLHNAFKREAKSLKAI